MVAIVPGAFYTSFLILTSGQGDYNCTEVKIKNDLKKVCVVLVAYFVLRRHEKNYALEQKFLLIWGSACKQMLRTLP